MTPEATDDKSSIASLHLVESTSRQETLRYEQSLGVIE
jgi:hypothetical protein